MTSHGQVPYVQLVDTNDKTDVKTKKKALGRPRSFVFFHMRCHESIVARKCLLFERNVKCLFVI